MRTIHHILCITFLLIASFLISCGGGSKSNEQQLQDSALSPLEVLNKKIAENPKADSLYQQRAELYLSMGETEKALSDVRVALQLNPEKPFIIFFWEMCIKQWGILNPAKSS